MTTSPPLSQTVFRVIDVEGTDRDPHVSEAVEVAWQDIDRALPEIQFGAISMLLNPGIPIPPSASAVHHLVDEDVAGAPALGDLDPACWDGPDVYVAHGAEYDRTVLGLESRRWLCTHRLAKHLWPWIGNHSNQEIRYTLRLKVDLPKDTPHHRAAADVAVTTAILLAALERVPEHWPEVRTIDDLITAANAPALLFKVPFKSAGGATFEDASTDHLNWIVRTGAGGPDCVHTAEHWLRARGFDSERDEDYDS